MFMSVWAEDIKGSKLGCINPPCPFIPYSEEWRCMSMSPHSLRDSTECKSEVTSSFTPRVCVLVRKDWSPPPCVCVFETVFSSDCVHLLLLQSHPSRCACSQHLEPPGKTDARMSSRRRSGSAVETEDTRGDEMRWKETRKKEKGRKKIFNERSEIKGNKNE